MNPCTDVSYGVHPNMRGHIEGTISFSIDIMHGKVSKLKISIKSSIESQLKNNSKIKNE